MDPPQPPRSPPCSSLNETTHSFTRSRRAGVVGLPPQAEEGANARVQTPPFGVRNNAVARTELTVLCVVCPCPLKRAVLAAFLLSLCSNTSPPYRHTPIAMHIHILCTHTLHARCVCHDCAISPCWPLTTLVVSQMLCIPTRSLKHEVQQETRACVA